MQLSRRNLLSGAGAGFGLSLASPWVRPAHASAGSLNLYNWSDYIGETTIEDFQSQTGINVIYDLYTSAEEMQARMQAGSTGYDLVVQSGQDLARAITAGTYQKLDGSRLKNWSNLDPALLTALHVIDPNIHGMPYLWGSSGLIFNMDMVQARLPGADLASLDVILNPESAAKLADCGISLLDSPQDTGFMVLSWLGIDPSNAGPDDCKKLVDTLKPVRKYIRTFDNSSYVSGLANQQICVANGWSGDFGIAKARAAEAGVTLNLQYQVPTTGVPAWVDLWCMPADARNLDSAYAFLDYMLRPEVIAKCTNYTGYANANKAATTFVDPAIATDPAIYPDAETFKRIYLPKPQSAEQQRDLNRAWAEITAG